MLYYHFGPQTLTHVWKWTQIFEIPIQSVLNSVASRLLYVIGLIWGWTYENNNDVLGVFLLEFGNDYNGVGLGDGHVIDISQPTF